MTATMAKRVSAALAHHNAGRLAEAEGLYAQILAVEPSFVDARYNLGLALLGLGRVDEAAEAFRRTLAIRPDHADAHFNLGNALYLLGHAEESLVHFRAAVTIRPNFGAALGNLSVILTGLGRIEEVVADCRSALAADPDAAAAAYTLGNALRVLERGEEAVAAYRRAVAIRPHFADAHNNLGNLLRALGRPDEAVASFAEALTTNRTADTLYNLGNALRDLDSMGEAVTAYHDAIALDPGHVLAHNNLGVAYQQLERHDDAIACFRRVLELDLRSVDALDNLGNSLKENGSLEDAKARYREALTLMPDSVDAHNGLGLAFLAEERLAEASGHFQIAIALKPGMPDAHNNLGLVARTQRHYDQAFRHFDQALTVYPDMADAWRNRALTLFATGRLRQGWVDYEWRWKGPKRQPKRPFQQPWWDGRAIPGQRLLIWGEQGLGDEILGLGMLPDVLPVVGDCVYECEPRLVELFARSFPTVSFVPRGDPADRRAVDADYQVPVLGLGRFLRNELAAFPRHAGYLRPDAAKVERWSEWLHGLGPGLKVGLTWRSRLIGWDHSHAFAPLDRLAILLGCPGVVFVSLQYDSPAEDIDTMRRQTGVVIHCPPDLEPTNDLDGVAALISCLDAVVGPATASVILAGALNVPAWMYIYFPVFGEILTFNADRVPWSPSIRVERRYFGEDWTGALTRIAEELHEVAEERVRGRETP